MVKRLRLEDIRTGSRRKRRPPQDRWVLEPRDAALIAVAGLLVVWLQWLFATLTS